MCGTIVSPGTIPRATVIATICPTNEGHCHHDHTYVRPRVRIPLTLP